MRQIVQHHADQIQTAAARAAAAQPSPVNRRHLWLVLIAGLLALPGVLARPELDAAIQTQLVEAVTAAVELDAYHARCRGDGSGRRIENLNKLIVGKLRLTVLTIQDDFFPERSYRRAQERLERTFIEHLQAVGGCAAAKVSPLPAALRHRYDNALEAIRRLP